MVVQTATSTQIGSALVVTTADVPLATGVLSDGSEVYSGTDVKKQLDTVVDAACTDNDQSKCCSQLRKVLVSILGLRQIEPFTLMTAAVIMVLAAVITQAQLDPSKNEIQADVHLPMAQLVEASILHAVSSSLIALATGSASLIATSTAKPTLTFNAAPTLM